MKNYRGRGSPRIAGQSRAVLLSIVLAVAFAAYADVAANTNRARGVLSFVIKGCNRVAASDVSPGNLSTANLAQLERSFAEIAEIKQRPKIVFLPATLLWVSIHI